MARPYADEEEEKPLDPAVERVRKKLVRFVAINLGLLLIALMAVVGAIVYRSGTPTPKPASEQQMAGTIRLPAGARIVSQSLSGDRIAFDIEMADQRRTIILYDMSSDKVVGRFEVSPE
jgi:hypothetical protein